MLNGTQFTTNTLHRETKSLDAILRYAFLPFSLSASLSILVICFAFSLTSTVDIEHNRHLYNLQLMKEKKLFDQHLVFFTFFFSSNSREINFKKCCKFDRIMYKMIKWAKKNVDYKMFFFLFKNIRGSKLQNAYVK